MHSYVVIGSDKITGVNTVVTGDEGFAGSNEIIGFNTVIGADVVAGSDTITGVTVVSQKHSSYRSRGILRI